MSDFQQMVLFLLLLVVVVLLILANMLHRILHTSFFYIVVNRSGQMEIHKTKSSKERHKLEKKTELI